MFLLLKIHLILKYLFLAAKYARCCSLFWFGIMLKNIHKIQWFRRFVVFFRLQMNVRKKRCETQWTFTANYGRCEILHKLTRNVISGWIGGEQQQNSSVHLKSSTYNEMSTLSDFEFLYSPLQCRLPVIVFIYPYRRPYGRCLCAFVYESVTFSICAWWTFWLLIQNRSAAHSLCFILT